MSRSQRSRQGYVPLQKARNDRPWAMQDKQRKDKFQKDDLQQEGRLQGRECFMHAEAFRTCRKCAAPFCPKCATWKPESFKAMSKEEFCDACRTKKYDDDMFHRDWLDDMRDYLDD